MGQSADRSHERMLQLRLLCVLNTFGSRLNGRLLSITSIILILFGGGKASTQTRTHTPANTPNRFQKYA